MTMCGADRPARPAEEVKKQIGRKGEVVFGWRCMTDRAVAANALSLALRSEPWRTNRGLNHLDRAQSLVFDSTTYPYECSFFDRPTGRRIRK